MPPASSFVLALGMLFTAAGAAAQPSFCASVCDSERRACRADAQQLAAEDGDGLIKMQERNHLARTALQTQSPSRGELANERSSVQARRIGRTAACEDTYQRCTRSCQASDSLSPVLTPRKSG
jgi:hypothetical protein